MLEKKIKKLGVYLQEKKFVKLKIEAEKILKKHPNAIQALQLLGIALLMQKRYDEAEVSLKKALAQKPTDSPILDTFANLYYLKADYPKSLSYQLTSLKYEPNNPDGLEKLGDIYSRGGNPFKAILAYKESYFKGNQCEKMLLRMVKLLRTNGRVEEAQDLLEKVNKENPKRKYEEINNLIELGSVELGIQKVDELRVSTPEVSKELINIYKELGELQKSRDIANDMRDQNLPVSAFSAISFGLVDESWLQNFLKQYPVSKVPSSSVSQYYFSLASFYKKTNKIEWFKYINLANGVKDDKAKKFNITTELAILDKVISTHKKITLTPSGLETSVPIFIVGMPRSGTTLTETIIGTHSLCKHIGESAGLNYSLKMGGTDSLYEGLDGLLSYLNDLENLDLKTVGEDYIRIVRNHSRTAKHLVDKMPHNFLHLGVIAKVFPNAKIIHCRRNPIDTCLSIYEQNFKGFHNYGNSLDTLIPYYKKYQDIMAYWKESLPEGSFYESDYEALTSNSEEEVRKLLDYCNLPFEQQCLEFNKQKRTVKTASVEQVRQGIYKSSQKRWEGIEEQVKPLLDAFPESVS